MVVKRYAKTARHSTGGKGLITDMLTTHGSLVFLVGQWLGVGLWFVLGMRRRFRLARLLGRSSLSRRTRHHSFCIALPLPGSLLLLNRLVLILRLRLMSWLRTINRRELHPILTARLERIGGLIVQRPNGEHVPALSPVMLLILCRVHDRREVDRLALTSACVGE